MNIKLPIGALAACLLATSVWAQTATAPLNLKLPPDSVPASSATAAAPASSSTVAGKSSGARPGVYYGDTSGRIDDSSMAEAPACDDSKFNQPQVHGSLTTGVVSGSHIGTGTYDAGEVNVTKTFGSCDHPTGAVSFSVGVGNSNFGGGGYRGHGY